MNGKNRILYFSLTLLTLPLLAPPKKHSPKKAASPHKTTSSASIPQEDIPAIVAVLKASEGKIYPLLPKHDLQNDLEALVPKNEPKSISTLIAFQKNSLPSNSKTKTTQSIEPQTKEKEPLSAVPTNSPQKSPTTQQPPTEKYSQANPFQGTINALLNLKKK